MEKLKILPLFGTYERYYIGQHQGHTTKFEPIYGYDSKVNLDTLEYCTISDKEYKEKVWPTLKQLLNTAVIEECSDLEEYSYQTDLYLEDYDGNLDIDAILVDFAKHGYYIDKEAILHNLHAWEEDMKSGYRGEDYFLFTPCGCNRLRFDATRLIDGCDWQHTYEC